MTRQWRNSIRIQLKSHLHFTILEPSFHSRYWNHLRASQRCYILTVVVVRRRALLLTLLDPLWGPCLQTTWNMSHIPSIRGAICVIPASAAQLTVSVALRSAPLSRSVVRLCYRLLLPRRVIVSVRSLLFCLFRISTFFAPHNVFNCSEWRETTGEKLKYSPVILKIFLHRKEEDDTQRMKFWTQRRLLH